MLTRMLRPRRPRAGDPRPALPLDHGRTGPTATTIVEPPGSGALTLAYAPARDGDPDAGEVVWTWVPYVEGDGRGKDRPVLVVARQSKDRVFAVRLTSKSPARPGDHVALGTGEWDSAGRASWVDISRLYSVHTRGMRREAAGLDPERFALVARALHDRYGWRGPR